MMMFGERAQQSGDNRKGQRATAKGLPLHLIIVGAILYGCPSFMVAHRFHFEALCVT